MVRTVDQVYLEVADAALLVDYRGTVVDGDPAYNLASPVLLLDPLAVRLLSMSQMRPPFRDISLDRVGSFTSSNFAISFCIKPAESSALIWYLLSRSSLIASPIF